MFQNVLNTALQEEALHAIVIVPEDRLPILIQFAKFLSSSSYENMNSLNTKENITLKRKKIAGSLRGKIHIADDFNQTPDCFQDYI